MLDMREPWFDEPVETRTTRLAPWILVGVVFLLIALVVVFLSFAPSANAAGSCGGG